MLHIANVREAVLVGLGWHLHRIWSTAWFKDRDSEIERLVAAIQLAQVAPSAPFEVPKHEDEAVTEASPADSIPATPRQSQQPSSEAIQAYEFCQLAISLDSTDLHLVPTGRLVEWLAEVVAVESPVHWIEASRRIADAVGIQRMGSRIQDALIRASRQGSRAKKFIYKDDFLFSAAQGQCPIRDLPVVCVADDMRKQVRTVRIRALGYRDCR